VHGGGDHVMSKSWDPRLGWGVLATLVALIAFLFYLRHREDLAIAQIVEQLQPGMTDSEVQRVLGPMHRSHMVTAEGNNLCYIIYGLDEFIIIVMEEDGESMRVQKVIHKPDLGPWWERFRRKWESRLR
jgi:hypothetical protein